MSKPSALVVDQLDALRTAARLGPIVDLACGRGRNALALARAGLDCIGFDRNRDFLRELREAAAPAPGSGRLAAACCDLEDGNEIPVRAQSCGAILVFRFLFRPLAPAIVRALAPGGLLLYETFTQQQTSLGWGPSRPEFLLEAGELPALFPDLEILHHDEAPSARPQPEASARLVARKSTRPRTRGRW